MRFPAVQQVVRSPKQMCRGSSRLLGPSVATVGTWGSLLLPAGVIHQWNLSSVHCLLLSTARGGADHHRYPHRSPWQLSLAPSAAASKPLSPASSFCLCAFGCGFFPQSREQWPPLPTAPCLQDSLGFLVNRRHPSCSPGCKDFKNFLSFPDIEVGSGGC